MAESAHDPATLRRVVVPSEHGSWAFLGEPLLLGLLVAPSPSGILVALAATAGFLARRPLRIVLADRRAGERFPRTAVAERALAALALLGARAAYGLSPRRPRLTVPQLGLSEIGFGLMTVLSVWLGRVSSV